MCLSVHVRVRVCVSVYVYVWEYISVCFCCAGGGRGGPINGDLFLSMIVQGYIRYFSIHHFSGVHKIFLYPPLSRST